MIARNPSFVETCTRLYIDFFEKYPNNDLCDRVSLALAVLLKHKKALPGAAAGWAAGIVYAASSIGVGVPGILNNELEQAFGVKMSTIYKRAAQVRKMLDLYPGM